jgi:exopolyphosphatase/guanosine-5'-triphosphate,3'-diphosphate pyrophosphatase
MIEHTISGNRHISIIDIGSNSIRLVVYEITEERAYRIIGDYKESARLSQHVHPDGILGAAAIDGIVHILLRFKAISRAFQADTIRAVATAAIRNSANAADIVNSLEQQTGLRVELLSGEEEARLGFAGMIRSIHIQDGFLVDLGGGSTEISLFRGSKLIRSVSFPFGAVNTADLHCREGRIAPDSLPSIRHMIEQALLAEPWIREHPGLSLVGLGGTIRSLCKISQKLRGCSFQSAHNAILTAEDMNKLMEWLPSIPPDKRDKIDGLTKEREDIIVPGLTILHHLFMLTGSTRYIVSGSGLRDGVFLETLGSIDQNDLNELSEEDGQDEPMLQSAYNLLRLHRCVHPAHAEQVRHISCILFDSLQEIHQLPMRYRQLLAVSALLYRIGVSVNYYQYAKHTFYVIANSKLDGLTHREALLCAMTASFKSKSRAQKTYMQYHDILAATDVQLAVKLGTILQLAISLDVSETQPITDIEAVLTESSLELHLLAKQAPDLELKKSKELLKDIRKSWGIPIKVHVQKI